MAIFAVMVQPNEKAPNLRTAIAAIYPDDHLKISDDAYLVAAKGTTAKEISDKLEISSGTNGLAVILQTTDFWGRASTATWAWLKAKGEATSGG